MSIFSKRSVNGSKGFTLIELLVVVAIIGILSSIVLASLNSARQKGRDARRVSDLKQLQLALELYYDANGAYPAAISSVAPTYISVVPDDPGAAANAYGYVQTGSGTGYYLGAILEATGQTASLSNDVDDDQAITVNAGATNCNANAGAANEAVYCVKP